MVCHLLPIAKVGQNCKWISLSLSWFLLAGSNKLHNLLFLHFSHSVLLHLTFNIQFSCSGHAFSYSHPARAMKGNFHEKEWKESENLHCWLCGKILNFLLFLPASCRPCNYHPDPHNTKMPLLTDSTPFPQNGPKWLLWDGLLPWTFPFTHFVLY